MSNTNLTGLEYVEKSGAALADAKGLAETIVAEQEKVASTVTDRVTFLSESNLIQGREKEAAAEQLSRHDGALDMVGSLTQILLEQKQASAQTIAELKQRLSLGGLGESDPSGQKIASAATRSDDLEAGGFVGQRAGSQEVRQSDLPLMKAAGLATRS